VHIRWCRFSPLTNHQSNPTVSAYLAASGATTRQFQALDIYTQHAWTAAMVFAEAARRAGAGLNRSTLAQALESIRNFKHGLVSAAVVCAGAHDPNHASRTRRTERPAGRGPPRPLICS